MTIQSANPPTIADLTLSATSPGNLTTDDLNCAYALGGSATTSGTAWKLNGSPLMVLYLPMEGGATNAIKDYSGNNHTVVATATWNATAGRNGFGAYTFNGSTDLRAGEHFPLNSSYTKSAWVKRTGTTSSGGNIISGDQDPLGHAFWASDVNGYKLSAGHNQHWQTVMDPAPLAVNTWYFVAVTFDYASGLMILYKDGTEVNRATMPVGDRSTTDPTISIGSFGSMGWPWLGAIDDARVHARALSPEQIAALYSSGQNLVKFTETAVGETWQASVTPFSASAAGTTSGSNVITIQAADPPLVTIHPVSQSVTEGQTATFTVEATGTAPLSFQWQKNGVDIPDADTSFYATPATTLADNGALFRCIVSNVAGKDTSDAATLTVNALIGALHHFAISTIPSPQTANVAFSITVTAQDIDNNTVTDFTGTVALGTTAGTINPLVSGSFVDGQRTESITLSSGGVNRTVSATRTGGGESGISNVFDVLSDVFTEAISVNPGGDFGAWGDIDNDDDLDMLVTGNWFTNIFRNSPGSFTNINAGLLGVYQASGAWGDYDNDGDLDVVVLGTEPASGEPRRTKLYMNNGAGFTEVPTNLPQLRMGSAAWGDYDNDGDLDLALGGNADGTARICGVYRNDDGVFTDINAGLTGVRYPSLAWGDFDNDADLDLVMTGEGAGDVPVTKLYRNDNGSFVEINVGLVNLMGSSAAWGDYDADGDLDLLLTGSGAAIVARVYNNNSGVFTDIGAGLTGLAGGTRSAAWGDYDNDGDLDIALTGGTLNATKVYRNDGGSFTDINAAIYGLAVGSVAWGDYDNDGDLDLLEVGTISYLSPIVAKVFRNNTATPNTIPSAPPSLTSDVTGPEVTFNWGPSTDGQTSPDGLTYNLRVGTSAGGSQVITPMAKIATGQRLLPAAGLTNANRTRLVKNLAPGTYYWSVQAIDNAFAGGPFAEEQSFTIAGPLHHFVISTISSPQTVDVPFSITITAQDVNDNTVTAFIGTVDLTTTAGTTTPSVSGAFVSGQWTGNVSVSLEGTAQTVTATATGGTETGTSNTFDVIIPPTPTLADLILTASSPGNFTIDDLTCGYSLTGNAITSATAWYRNDNPLMVLYLPMEGGATNAIKDYSGNNHTVVATATWDATAGRDGFGAYMFNGTTDLRAGEHFPLNSSYTKSAWVKRTGTTSSGGNIISGDQDPLGHAFWASDVNGYKLSAGHNQHWQTVMDPAPLAVNTWYFVAVTFDYASGLMILYKDGTEVNRATMPVGDRSTTDPTISIGSFGSMGWPWLGAIDDARVHARALSPEQIAALYSSGQNLIKSTETAVAETWQARVTPFSGTEAGATYPSNILTIQAADPPQITLHPLNQAVLEGQTAIFTVEATGTAPLSFQWQKNEVDIPDADESSYTTPATTLADNGALFRCIVRNDFGRDTSNAATLTVTIPVGPLHHFDISTITSPQTVDVPFGITIIAHDINNNTVTDFLGTVDLTTTAGTITPLVSGAFTAGQWTGNVSVSLEGTGRTVTATNAAGPEAGTSNTFDVILPLTPTLANLMLAASSPGNFTVDDLMCSYSLTGNANTAATAWYRNNNPLMVLYLPMEGGATNAIKDYSGNNHAVVATATWDATAGRDGFGAYVFNGTTDLRAGDHFPLNASYTKAAWVKRTGTTSSGGNIISGDQDPNGHAFWASDINGYKLSAGHNQHWQTVIDPTPLALNTWYFVAVTFDYASGEMILYKNGAEVHRATVPAGDKNITDPTISIGSFGNIGWKWNGVIDDARVYGRALSPVQIAALYSTGQNIIKSPETVTGETWQVRVTPFSVSEAGPTSLSNILTIQAADAPQITLHPANQTVVEGQTATFTVIATGTSPLSYQWQKNEVNIPDADTSVYTTPATTLADNGALFRCVVTNMFGSQTSTNAILTVQVLQAVFTAQPEAITFGNGSLNTTINRSLIIRNTGTAALQVDSAECDGEDFDMNPYSGCALQPGDSAEYQVGFTPLAHGSHDGVVVFFSNSPTSPDTICLSGTCIPPVENIVRNPGFEEGTTNWLFYTDASGTFTAITPGYEGTRAGLISINTQGTNVQLFQTGIRLDPATEYILEFTAYSSTGHDVAVFLQKHSSPYTGYGVNNYVANLTTDWKTFSVEFTTPGFASPVSDGRLRFWLAPYDATGDSYYFDNVIIRKKAGDVPASITGNPVNQTVVVGQTATFTVTCAGFAPLSYRWQKNGINIDGAVNPGYTTPPTILSDNGALFRCIVWNSMGSDTSDNALLTVNEAPACVNVVKNQSFESGTASWSFYTNGAGSYTAVPPGFAGTNAAKINIVTQGTNVQLFQTGIVLKANTNYRFSFAAYSNTGHDVAVSIQKHVSPYTGYGLVNYVCNLTTSWQTFTKDFRTTGFTGTVSDARLRFFVDPYDANGDVYYIDDVVLCQTGVTKDGQIEDQQVPEQLVLDQNYPNPFNPLTIVNYQLPVDCHVTLKIYDVLGREVVTLVDEVQKAGYKAVEWDATGFASGVYLYRLQAGEFVFTKKLVLMK